MDKIVDHLFILEVMGGRRFSRKYSDFRAYEDSTEVAQKKTKKRERLETKQPDWKLTFNEQKNQKIEKEIKEVQNCTRAIVHGRKNTG
jgi:ATP-binding cassette subfamily F protein uup